MASTPPKSALTKARPYFAWSVVLDAAERSAALGRAGQGAFRLPAGTVAEARDLDLAYTHSSERWGGRVAALVEKPGASVFGLLLEVPASDWPILQALEDAKSGEYVEVEVEVRSGGKVTKATAFTPSVERVAPMGQVSQRFADALARGAREAGLPAAYVTKLEAEAMVLQRVQAFGQRMGLEQP
jgi:hypothetical protein